MEFLSFKLFLNAANIFWIEKFPISWEVSYGPIYFERSFGQGATAVLLYGAIEAPFAQPRAIFFGHTISAVLGVGITKLFERSFAEHFDRQLWLAGSMSCSVASTVTAMLKIIHPPSGGTALIAATQADIRAMGWYYVPVVMLSSVLMITVGLITNNIQRRYPMYWWTSTPLKRRPSVESTKETIEDGPSRLESDRSLKTELTDFEKGTEGIIVSVERVAIPEFLALSYDQRAVLEELQIKLQEYYSVVNDD